MGQCSSDTGRCSSETCVSSQDCRCFASEGSPVIEVTGETGISNNALQEASLCERPIAYDTAPLAMTQGPTTFDSFSAEALRHRTYEHRKDERPTAKDTAPPAMFNAEALRHRTQQNVEPEQTRGRSRVREQRPAYVSFCTSTPEETPVASLVHPSSASMQPSLIFSTDHNASKLTQTLDEMETKTSTIGAQPQERAASFEEGSIAEDTDGVCVSEDLTTGRDSKDLVNDMTSETCITTETMGANAGEIDPSDHILGCVQRREGLVETDLQDRIGELPEAEQSIREHAVTSVQLGEQQQQMAIGTNTETNQRFSEEEKIIENGDIVIVDIGVPREYCNCAAIVTEKFDNHCTAVVLDASRRYGIGECWPNYENVLLDSTSLRLGNRVVVDRLQGTRTKHLNGRTGVISKHPRQGHPNFITKDVCPSTSHLTVCVAFDDMSGKQRLALLEPRFLTLWQEQCIRMSRTLTEISAMLSEAGSSVETGSGESLESPECQTPRPLS